MPKSEETARQGSDHDPAAAAAFVGGSLVPAGGHNVLEPAGLSIPVLFGPFMFNFDAIACNLVEAGAAVQVADKTALAVELLDIMQNETRRRRMGEHGRVFVEKNRGRWIRRWV